MTITINSKPTPIWTPQTWFEAVNGNADFIRKNIYNIYYEYNNGDEIKTVIKYSKNKNYKYRAIYYFNKVYAGYKNIKDDIDLEFYLKFQLNQ